MAFALAESFRVMVPALIHSIRTAGPEVIDVIGTDADVLPMRDGEIWLPVPFQPLVKRLPG